MEESDIVGSELTDFRPGNKLVLDQVFNTMITQFTFLKNGQ